MLISCSWFLQFSDRKNCRSLLPVQIHCCCQQRVYRRLKAQSEICTYSGIFQNIRTNIWTEEAFSDNVYHARWKPFITIPYSRINAAFADISSFTCCSVSKALLSLLRNASCIGRYLDLFEMETRRTFVSRTILKTISFGDYREFVRDFLVSAPYLHLSSCFFPRLHLPIWSLYWQDVYIVWVLISLMTRNFLNINSKLSRWSRPLHKSTVLQQHNSQITAEIWRLLIKKSPFLPGFLVNYPEISRELAGLFDDFGVGHDF